MESTNRVVHEGNSIISIETLPDYPGPVAVKRPSEHASSADIDRSLDREYEMTRSLDAVEGVRRALGRQAIDDQPVLILEHVDGENLRDHIAGTALDLRSRLEIAIDLARILGDIHRQGVIHLDLSSRNILIGNEQRTVHLIDLGSASRNERDSQQRFRPEHIVGTLAYISPEQTGRINRAVDERSDLYSLGVVLYELMTGQLPFETEKPIELIHCHIARMPMSPSEVSPEIPGMLSAIILNLLNKDAEDRYQSAFGLQHDLEECLRRLGPDGTVEKFPVGAADHSNRLVFPQKLYGRENELEELASAYESACRGASETVFVGGYSGIGKTALVEELQRPVSQRDGYLLTGKFDQLSTTPYSAIAQAFALFVSQILMQTKTQLAEWRSQILEAVGPNGKLLTDVVPSLELVIGPQPAVPDLSGQEAQNRFNYVFQRFFGATARSEHPVCLFLDDLQWIDPASLGLLKALCTSPDLAHLLFVGAYRDNEIHEDHPLTTLIEDFEKAGVNLRRMTLQKLAKADVDALISDVLRRGPGEIRELSRLVYSQTDGNPFFTLQVLRSMEDRGLIALDTTTGHWRWDMDALRDQSVTASVVELLVGRLKELPVDIQETLKIAACIGNQFDTATLTVVAEGDDDAILDHVHKAVAAGLIWERDDRGFFVHDRVQEAAYTLVPIEERDRLHITIGRHLLERHRASDEDQDIYRIVDQLNHGLHLVEDEQERVQIARLNLQAAGAARQANAFDTGLTYAKAGIELLGENSWNQDYRLTLELSEQAALLAYAAADIPGMEHHSEQVLQFGRDPLDLARVQRMRVEFLLSSKSFDEAIDFGLQALRILGQEFPPKPDMEFAIAKVSELLERLECEPPDFFSMARLYDQDQELLAISEILMPVANAAFVSRPALAPLLYIRYLELALERQLLPVHTPVMIAALGILANALLGKIELAYEYGESALELASRAAFHTSSYAPLHVHALHHHFWRKPLRETLGLFDRALRSAHDFGNNEFVAYATLGWSKHAFYSSIELAQVEERSLKLRTFLDGIQNVNQSRWVNILVTAAQALRGSSSALGTCWRGTPFDDDLDLSDLQQFEDQLGLLFVYSAKAWVATLFGDHSGVEEYSDLSCSLLMVQPTGLEKAMLAFICGLRRARELRVTPESSESEQALQEQLDLLERFAGLAPMNFAHKLSLVQAEVHRARGEVVQAMRSYEKASQGARENGYLSEAGLAHALAAEFYQDLGLQQEALHNAEQAARAWRSWGAHALVENLSHRFADLLSRSDSPWAISGGAAGREAATQSDRTASVQMDLDGILSASQTLASETHLDRLLEVTLKLVMGNAGAQRGVLLLRHDDDWLIEAEGHVDQDEIAVEQSKALDESGHLPSSLIHYVARTRETVVLSNAAQDGGFVQDAYVDQQRLKSVLAMPLVHQGELNALLYLENNLATDVFTDERVEVLSLLSSQMAMALENARLYARLEERVAEKTTNLAESAMLVEQLRESQERYELAVAGSAAGLWDWDIASGTIHYSDRFQELLGYESDGFSNSLDEFWDRLHPDDAETVRQSLDRHLQSREVYDIDYHLQTKSGEYRWFYARGQALWDDDGEPTRMSGSISDITDRKLAEEELVKSEERFRMLMEQSPMAMEILSPDGRILQVNSAWKKLWNTTDEEAAATLEKYNMLTDPQNVDLGVAELTKKAFEGEPVTLPPCQYSAQRTTEDFDLPKMQVRAPWIQCHLYPVKDQEGNVDFVVNTYQDITDIKRAEAETRQHQDAIARLNRATSMGQLTGSIAHELNQPLTGILSNAQAVEMMISSGQWDNEELAEIMAEIVADTKRGGEVIHGLRELYREQKGEYQPVDINAVVEETRNLLHSEYIAQHIVVTTETTPSIPPIDGNRIQIQQVLVNLIMNGVQAMVDTPRDCRCMRIMTDWDATEVTVSVEDCGHGIDPETIDKIFEPLATWRPGGTGMGLAISNSIIEAHGGRMWAENKPDGGVLVGFAIPKLNEDEQK